MTITYRVTHNWHTAANHFGADAVSMHRSLAAAIRRAQRETRLAERCGCDCVSHTISDDEGEPVMWVGLVDGHIVTQEAR